MTVKNSDIYVNLARFCRKKRLSDGNLQVQFGFSLVFSCIIRAGITARNLQTASESLVATLHPALSFLCDTP
jgi:hypothetical protein